MNIKFIESSSLGLKSAIEHNALIQRFAERNKGFKVSILSKDVPKKAILKGRDEELYKIVFINIKQQDKGFISKLLNIVSGVNKKQSLTANFHSEDTNLNLLHDSKYLKKKLSVIG